MTLEQKISTLSFEEREELLELVGWALTGIYETTTSSDHFAELRRKYEELQAKIEAASDARASSPSPSSAS